MVLKDDLLTEMVEGNSEKKISEIKREVVVITDDKSLRTSFNQLNERNSHMAVIVDEYGALRGIVTLEDIFETLFGIEFTDESDSVEDMRKFARRRWEKRAKALGLIE